LGSVWRSKAEALNDTTTAAVVVLLTSDKIGQQQTATISGCGDGGLAFASAEGFD